MALSEGTRLGPYEILSPIGAGGMGEVYRARDTRLDRTVAIKVLPSHLSSDTELRQRFEREAKAVSSLNHPHISTLHDIGHQDGIDYLVMEYLEGETLGARLINGPLQTDHVLRYAIQIADALDKAHRQGVVHRDLKPGNIMLTKSGAKLLDFGVAKLRDRQAGSGEAGVTGLPTENRSLTGAGSILGTVQYMAPEQLEGKEADARADIFAFGAVVYEMATGLKAFQGESQASLIGAILRDDPPVISTLQPMTPPALDHIVKRCLAKDRDDRFQTARDVTLELQWIADEGSQVQMHAPVAVHRKNHERIGWVLAVLLIAVVTGLAVWNLRPPLEERRVARFDITPPQTAPLLISGIYPDAAVSPDGRYVVYRGRVGDGEQLYLSSVGQFDATLILGTEGQFVGHPFFSPDGTEIGFKSGPLGEVLKKVPIQGGIPVTLGTFVGQTACWGPDGSIISGRATVGLFRVAAAGAEPEALTVLDSKKGELRHGWPETLPNGRAVLFSMYTEQGRQLAVLDLETKDYRHLGVSGSNPHYAPTGHIVYGRDEDLWAVAFDLSSLEIRGDPVAVLENVYTKPEAGAVNFSLSNEGSLLYVPGIPSSERKLVWVDREGSEYSFDADPRYYEWPRISRDGQKVVVTVADSGNTDVWIHDLAHNTQTRLTRAPSFDTHPFWTPDGERIVFASNREGSSYGLYWRRADGTGPVDLLMMGLAAPSSWSADGQLLFHDLRNIGVLSMEGARTQRLLLDEEFSESDPEVSPNGRWIAYTSAESGRNEIYVRPFPNVDERRWTISRGGGVSPAWSSDGKELFYRNGDKMMVVEITASSFSHGASKELFAKPYHYADGRQYDVHPDGKRFLMIKQVEQAEPQLIIVLNWFEELKRLVPTDD